jgi:hypothetical protein
MPAAALVVPIPANGSRTVSPAKENIRISRSASSSGKAHGCRGSGSGEMSQTDDEETA